MLVEIKKGNKTIYKNVPDNWKPDDTDDYPHGDLTTGTAKHVALNITKERHQEIFGNKNGSN